MKFTELKCVSENVNLDEYLWLYSYVRDNMEHKEWLGTFTREEIEDVLSAGGKIFMYYDGTTPVCSMFYMPVKNKTLTKHNVEHDESIVGSLGPIMVSKDYVGNGFQREMMKVLDEYAKSIGKEYIYTKAQSENIYSINNMLKNGYEIVHEYESERGMATALIKKIILIY